MEQRLPVSLARPRARPATFRLSELDPSGDFARVGSHSVTGPFHSAECLRGPSMARRV